MVDRDLDKVNTNSIKLTYDNDSDTNTGSTKHDQNTQGTLKDIDTQDNVQNTRHDKKVTHVKWSTETNQIDNQYLRDYENMRRQIEDKHNGEYYKVQRQIHKAIMGDTPVKTAHNCTIPVPVIVLCLSTTFVRNINSSELHFQSVALRSQYSDHAPEAVTLH